MLIMGTLVGACLYFFGQCEQFGLVGYASGWKFLIAFIFGLFLIPCGNGLDVRGWGFLTGPKRLNPNDAAAIQDEFGKFIVDCIHWINSDEDF